MKAHSRVAIAVDLTGLMAIATPARQRKRHVR
jgi:hypothetical protein